MADVEDRDGGAPNDNLDDMAPAGADAARTNGVMHAGQAEVIMSRERKGSQWSPGRELLELQPDPASYLPRTNITDVELSRLIRLKADVNRTTRGHTDLAELTAFFAFGRIGVDGQGQKNAVAIATGEKAHRERMSGFGGRVAERSQTIDKGEVTRS